MARDCAFESLDDHLTMEAYRILDMCDSIVTTFSLSDEERASVGYDKVKENQLKRKFDRVEPSTGMYRFRRRGLSIEFNEEFDGHRVDIYYDGKQVVYILEGDGNTYIGDPPFILVAPPDEFADDKWDNPEARFLPKQEIRIKLFEDDYLGGRWIANGKRNGRPLDQSYYRDPYWLREIESLYNFAGILEAKNKRFIMRDS